MRVLIVVAAALLAPAGALAQAPPTSAQVACDQAQYDLNAQVAQITQAQNSYPDLAFQEEYAKQQYQRALASAPEFTPGTPLYQFNPGNPVQSTFDRWKDAWGQVSQAAFRIKTNWEEMKDIEARSPGCNLTKPPLQPPPEPPPPPPPQQQ